MTWTLRPTRGDRDTYRKLKTICPGCGKAKTDEQFFRSACFKKIRARKESKQNADHS